MPHIERALFPCLLWKLLTFMLSLLCLGPILESYVSRLLQVQGTIIPQIAASPLKISIILKCEDVFSLWWNAAEWAQIFYSKHSFCSNVSKDAGLSSSVSIEPNTDCSQWLSSVSDMKEWAQACLTAPNHRFQGKKKDVQKRKIGSPPVL